MVDTTRVPSEATVDKIEQAGKSSKLSPQAELESLVVTAGYTFNHLQKFGMESGNIEGADSIASFAEVPSDVAKRLLKAKKESLIAGLEMAKATGV